MAINLICSKCHKTAKRNTAKCKCGNNLRKNRAFKVRIKLPSGRWKSKRVIGEAESIYERAKMLLV